MVLISDAILEYYETAVNIGFFGTLGCAGMRTCSNGRIESPARRAMGHRHLERLRLA